jgi:hypothetical protein
MITISSVPHSHVQVEEGLLGPNNPVGNSYMLDIYKIGPPQKSKGSYKKQTTLFNGILAF